MSRYRFSALVLLALSPALLASRRGRDPVEAATLEGTGPAPVLLQHQSADTSTYLDAATRRLVETARERHKLQDALVHDYTATVRSRVDAGIGRNRFVKIRPWVAYESIGRLQWQAPNDMKLDLKGMRMASRFKGIDADVDYDRPWFVPRSLGDSIRLVAESFPERAAVHPLADGAERFYRYRIVDSLEIALPDRTVRAIGVRVEPKFNGPALIAGDIWLDADTYEVVRMTFLFLGEFLWEQPEGRTPEDTAEARKENKWANRILRVEADLEYALLSSTYWMPRRQVVTLNVEIPFLIKATIPVRFITTFSDYEINTGKPLHLVSLGDYVDIEESGHPDSVRLPDGTWVRADSVKIPDGSIVVVSDEERVSEERENRARRENRRRKRDRTELLCPRSEPKCSLSRKTRDAFGYARAGGSAKGRWEIVFPPRDSMLAYQWPDTLQLELENAEEKRIRESIATLANIAEDLPDQWVGRMPSGFAWERASDLFRFNRVQGPSFGGGYQWRPGPRYTTLLATARFGITDKRPMGTLTWRRDAPGGTLEITAFRRLNEAEPWTRGLSLGNTFNAVFAAHDDADYYQALGGGISFLGNYAAFAETKLTLAFERHLSTRREAKSGINDLFAGDGRLPLNPPVTEGNFVRASVERPFRFGEARFGVGIDGLAGGDNIATGRAWGSAKLPVVISGHDLVLSLRTGGLFGDDLPQLAFRAGGPFTVRGYDYGFRRGRVFWSAQLDVPVMSDFWKSWIVFIDAGDAKNSVGDLTSGDPLVSIGTGLSFFKGFFRLDLAKGINPGEDVRFDFRFGAPR